MTRDDSFWNKTQIQPRRYGYGHSNKHHADVVYSARRIGHGDEWQMQTWMVPGTYDAEADMPPPTVHRLCGYKFNPDNGVIEVHGLQTAQGLRYLADLIEKYTVPPGVDHVYINGKPALI